MLGLELQWWILTILVTVAVLIPIEFSVGWGAYPYLFINALFVIVAITTARYIFLLPSTFLAPLQYVKAGIAIVMIPIIFLLIQEVNLFQTFLDEQGMEALVPGLGFQDQLRFTDYIRTEMIFFGVASIIGCVVLMFRLVLSVWLWRNRGRA